MKEEKLLQSHESDITHEKLEDIDVEAQDCLGRLKNKVQYDPRPVPELFQEEQWLLLTEYEIQKLLPPSFLNLLKFKVVYIKTEAKCFQHCQKKYQI